MTEAGIVDMIDSLQLIIKDVIVQHDLNDWYIDNPWLTGSLGNIHAPIWFLGENPSLSKVEEQSNANPESLDENLQWNISKGDQLLRTAITEAGLKYSTDPFDNDEWNCYITNVIKEPDYAGKRNVIKDATFLKKEAEIWLPVLQQQIEIGQPQVLVTMGGAADKLLKYMIKLGLNHPAEIINIYHYTSVFNWPDNVNNRPQGDPRRIQEYKEVIASIADITLHY